MRQGKREEYLHVSIELLVRAVLFVSQDKLQDLLCNVGLLAHHPIDAEHNSVEVWYMFKKRLE